MTIATVKAKFSVGQLIHHRLFGYRGVIADIHPVFQGSKEWYEQVAQSRPPIDEPWYRVLPHRGGHETYVAERNLEPDTQGGPILHPLVDVLFEDFRDGVYVHLVH
jgi:heat shock protein HspQ